MAIVRRLFVVLLFLAIALLIVGLLLPTGTRVERELVIDAPPEAVFPHVNSLRAFRTWSPWAEKAQDTRYEFSGPDTGVGARMRWHSAEPSVGSGTQEIVESLRPERVVTRLDFGEHGGGTAAWTLTPAGDGGTRVRWSFQTEFGWDILGRYVGLFLDGLIGAEYEAGLQRLKQRVESDGG